MKFVYGTNNPSKLNGMKRALKDLDLEIIGLADLELELDEVEEAGNNPLANAELKAKGYYKQIGKPVFSCDSGLYFEDVAEEDQPGVYIKRIHGNNLTYREMLDYYSKLAGKYGGRLTAYYKNAICVVMDENTIIRYDGEDISSGKFYLVDQPHEIYREGFPLDSISVEIDSGEYYYDLVEKDESELMVDKGFEKLFNRIMNQDDK